MKTKKFLAVLVALVMVVCAMTVVASATDPDYVASGFDAEYNTVYYETLSDAFAAGGSITLLSDVEVTESLVVPADGNVSLDLNGYTVSMEISDGSANNQLIQNKGYLSISDWSDAQTGKLTFAYTGASANQSLSTISNQAGATLEVNSGTIENATDIAAHYCYAYAIDSLTNGNLGDVSVYVYGGTVTSTYMGIRQFVNGQVCNNSLYIYGGNIHGEKCAVNVQVASKAFTDVNDCAVLEISGGTFAAGEEGYAVCVYGMSNNISVSGGDFTGWYWDGGTYYEKTTAAVSGGTFNPALNSSDVAEGYANCVLEDGSCYVYDPAVGTSNENYIEISFEWNADWTEATATIVVPTGTWYYGAYGIGGMNLSVNGGEATLLENVGFFYPTVLTYTNEGASAAVYELKLTYPAGSYNNPANLEIGYNTANVPGDGSGYHYTYTATEDGLLVITMSGDNWTYVINNSGDPDDWSDDVYGDNHYSNDETVISMEVVKVSAGDEIQIVMGTADWSAATIDFQAQFCQGTAEDPILVNFVWNNEWTEASVNVAAPAGEYVYGQYRIGGMILTVDGEAAEITDGGFYAPGTFAVSGGEAGVHSMVLTYPVGSMSNPDSLVVDPVEGHVYDNNTVALEANSQGYYYTWTAEEDGTLIITMPDGDWFYSVGNLTTYVFEDYQWSDSDPVLNPCAIEVSKGDVIQVQVNTYDPEDMWNTPAGELTFTAAFSADGKTHSIAHVEAKTPSCDEEGNIEYWYCTDCGTAWTDESCGVQYLTNLMSVRLGISHDVEHVEAKAPTCFEEGNIEYWYCTDCGTTWTDESCGVQYLTNQKSVILPVSHSIIHVEAKAPTATENGNIEHWYCEDCGYAWLDEYCHLNTNLLAVVLPADTGDGNVVVICAIAALLAVTGMAVVVITSKKRAF